MPTVWRVETEFSKQGPYDCGATQWLKNEYGIDLYDRSIHTPPFMERAFDEFALGYSTKLFGFAMLQQYERWFYSTWIRQLLTDFRSEDNEILLLRKYNATVVWLGETQVLFTPQGLELIEQRSLAYSEGAEL